MNTRSLAVLCLGLSMGAPAAHADSLWTASVPTLFVDRRAQQVGDLVTIIVVENSSSSQQANTAVSKKDKTTVGPGTGPILKTIPALGFGGQSDTTAQGSTSRTTSMAARITAEVTEVKPNGILVIQGTRNVITNNDTQILKLTGTIRARDVAPDNTIQSTFIADAKIELTGKGPIAERQKPGFITRMFRLLF